MRTLIRVILGVVEYLLECVAHLLGFLIAKIEGKLK